jgi:hypothetical protein
MGKQFLFIAILYILSVSSVLAGVRTEGYFCWFKECRKKITTTGPRTSTSIQNKKEAGTFNNKGIQSYGDFSYSYSSSNSRKFSAGLDVGANILGLEIKASLGGELQWVKTETFTGTQRIPPNKVGHAYLSDRVTTAVFTHQIQHQEKVSGKWKNVGPVKTSRSTVTTTIPELKIEIKDN